MPLGTPESVEPDTTNLYVGNLFRRSQRAALQFVLTLRPNRVSQDYVAAYRGEVARPLVWLRSVRREGRCGRPDELNETEYLNYIMRIGWGKKVREQSTMVPPHGVAIPPSPALASTITIATAHANAALVGLASGAAHGAVGGTLCGSVQPGAGMLPSGAAPTAGGVSLPAAH